MSRIHIRMSRPGTLDGGTIGAQTFMRDTEENEMCRPARLMKLGEAMELDLLRHFYRQPALLIVDLETLEVQSLVLPEGQAVVFGRDPQLPADHDVPMANPSGLNKVLLRSHRVSRTHAVLHERDGTLFVRDLGSKNGTSINHKPLLQEQDSRVCHGDIVQLGSTFMIRAFPLGASPVDSAQSVLFPLWLFLRHAQNENSWYLRCRYLVSVFEYIAKLIAFVGYSPASVLCPPPDIVQRSKLSMGHWVQCVRAVLTHAADADPSTSAPAQAFLRDASGAPRSANPLFESLNYAVRWRNDFVGHGVPKGDNTYRSHYNELTRRLREVVDRFPALQGGMLVSAIACEVLGSGTFRTKVVVHDPVWGVQRSIETRRSTPLMRGTYFVPPGTEELIALGSRVVLCDCPECGTPELFLAEGIRESAWYLAPVSNHRASSEQVQGE